MFEAVQTFDEQLLLLINGWHAPFVDEVMWVVSSKWINLPLALLLFLCLKKTRSQQQALLLLGFTILIVVCTDWVSSQLFKDFFQRLRPSHEILLGSKLHYYFIGPSDPYKGGQYGFVSSHAANLASVIAFLYPILISYKRSFWAFVAYASLVCYSRMYLGVHYPTDILCGALLGMLLAFLARKFLFQKFFLASN